MRPTVLANRLLGGFPPHRFLQRFWQKEPLLVRQAIPGFPGVASLRDLASLASRHDVESRFILRRGANWRVEHGPISPARLHRAPQSDWTLLVNGVNMHRAEADALLRRFAFVPQARLDDVMVSFAAPGGSVGPHVDSYDVFLLQAGGRRVWRYARPRAFRLAEAAPLRLIADFIAEEEVLLEPGDMLYLPPGWAHEGVALEPSFTCSVGFRAASGHELASGFLDWLQERGLPEADYRDPDLRPARRPAELPAALVRHARSVVARLKWSGADVARFMGQYLTAPKAHVVFRHRPRASRAAFDRALPVSLVSLDLKTQLLYAGRRFYVNGEEALPDPAQRKALAELADRRSLPGKALARARLGDLCFDWYRHGYVDLVRYR